MKQPLLKKLLPHLIALAIFLVVSILFCKPALQGNVLNQHDIAGWKGMAQNSFEYKEKKGHFPLWNPNLFSGMPNYQVAMEGKSVLPDLNKIFTLGLPKPISFFFLACISFYILSLAFGVHIIIAIFGSLAFAFATYNPIIVSVGHESKMWAIAYMPAVLAGLIFIYEKKYWIGLAIASVAAYLEIGVNHPQINFYFFMIAAAVTLVYLVKWIHEKDWAHLLKSVGLTAIVAITAIAGSAMILMTNNEYVKATMRGGKDVNIQGDSVTATKTSGLDTSYALRWSISKAETFVLMMPDAFGGSSGEVLNENSHVVKKLIAKGIPEGQAIQVATSLPKYWGGMSDPSETTSGPPYLGVVVCLLGLIGFVVYKKPLRWALLAVSVLSIMMAWGKYFPSFNAFLFDHLPLYNKFRAPSMTLVITQLTLPVIAILGLQQLLFKEKSKELLEANFKKILYVMGGLFGLLAILYLTLDYKTAVDSYVSNSIIRMGGNDEIARLVLAGLREDRKAMFGEQVLRSLGFAVAVLGLLYAYKRNFIKPTWVAIAFTLISTVELLIIDKQYLNDENFSTPDLLASENFTPTNYDKQILKDKDPDFRVLNLTGNPYTESRTSYFHKSIGGYHPAKLRIYQDVIDRYLSGPFNENILNMLNTKYRITENRQSGQVMVDTNKNAYGPCWLVKHVKLVKDHVEELQSIGNTDLRDTAIVQSAFSQAVTAPQWDSASSIQLTKFDNDTMVYSAKCTQPQFAVFSEIYYPYGWNAYIDGRKVDYVRTNYILRGLSIPAGDHTIQFIFEPSAYKNGVKIMYAASFLILLFFIGGIFLQWWTDRKKYKAAA
jgi:hypothetical protein